MTEELSTKEFCEATKASYRQIDYWVRNNVFFPIEGTGGGSGQPRKFSPDDVGPVTTLVHLSNNLDGAITTKTMSEVVDAFEDGVLYLGNGIELHWNVL